MIPADPNQPLVPYAPDPILEDEHADGVHIRDGILGEGVVINHTSHGDYVIHAVESGSDVREVGTFRNSVEAWRAIDALDLGTA